MKRSIARVMAVLVVVGLVAWLGPAARPLRADSGVSPAALTSFFVVGDQSAGAPTVGTSVQFWGAQWAKVNKLSGGPAPASFKGYADSGSVTLTKGVCSASGSRALATARRLPRPSAVLLW
jgi:hypothetical protein